MRKIFTILLIFGLGFFWINVQSQILWGGPNDPNSTFAGGFNGWTTQSLKSYDPTKSDKALWTWSAAASGIGGAFWGGRKSINAPSKSNGAMVFNSDFLDNGGDGNNQGNGPCPAAQSGVLISPVIDCSAFNTVAVKFNQYFRNYASSCFIDVTNDGGLTWTPFQVNRELTANNDSTLTDNQTTINIGCVASNQSAVQFRFRIEADYYFWIIDDVQLVVPPVYDVGLNSSFYSPSAYRIPKSQICMDTFVFSASLANRGSASLTNVVFKGEILDRGSKNILYSDSIIIDKLESCEFDTTFKTNHYFIPDALNFGKYYIRWSVYSKDAMTADFNIKDNTIKDSFEVSLENYAKAPRATGGVRAGNGAAYTFGNQYRTSDCLNVNDRFIAKEVVFQVVSNPGGTLDQYPVSVYLLKVHDDIDASFTNFVKTQGIASSSVDIISAESFICTTETNYENIKVELHDFNTGVKGIILDKSSRYFVGIDHPATPTRAASIFQAISNEKSYNTQAFSTFVIDNSGTWFNGFEGINTPICEINMNMIINTDNQPLPSNTMQLYPNPVVDNTLNVKLSFDIATNANLTLADINGKLLKFESHFGVTNEEFTINTSTLKSGNYLIRVTTDEGSSTKQFTVVR